MYTTEQVNRHLARAKRLYLCGRTARAKALCRKLLPEMDSTATWDQYYEQLTQLLTLLGRICLKQRSFSAACHWFDRLRQLTYWFAREYDEEPDSGQMLLASYGLALCQFRAGNYENARIHCIEGKLIAKQQDFPAATSLQRQAYRGLLRLSRLLSCQ